MPSQITDFNSLKNFKILSWNIHSLIPNDTDLTLLIRKYDPDIILLSETWLKDHIRKKFPGYNCFRDDRPDGYGGLLSLIKTKIAVYPITLNHLNLPMAQIEMQAFKIILDNKELIFLNCYIHPLSKFTLNDLQNFISANKLENKTLFWAGDLNSKHSLWGYDRCDYKGNALVEIAQNLNLFNINAINPQPTRKTAPSENKSFTDIAFCSEQLAQNFDWEALTEGGSDHFPCLYTFNKSYDAADNLTVTEQNKVNWSLKNWNLYRANLDRLLDQPTNSYQDFINKMNEAHEQAIHLEYNNHASNATSNSNRKSVSTSHKKHFKKIPWWNSECQLLKDRRDSLARKYKLTYDLSTYIEHQKTCAEFKTLIRKNKRLAWKNFTESLNHKTPAKLIFEKVKILNKALIPFQNTNDEWVDEFLTSLTPDSQAEQQWTESTSFTDSFEKFSIEELKLALFRLKKKSPGLDKVKTEFLTQLSPKAQTVLLNIFNDILLTKKIPETWKDIKIFTILKKDQSPSKSSSYRPIGIISAIRKLFEKLILNRIEYTLESQNKLSPFQFGFRKSKSIYHNLLNLSSHAYKALGEKKFMPTLFLDISNAYNNVNYSILLDKLTEVGINPDLAKLIFNLITNNNLHVSYQFKMWGPRRLSKGLTQGGILSPILYLIYSCDLHKNLKFSLISEFADDIVIFTLNESFDVAVNNIMEDFYTIYEQLKSLGLDLSLPKVKFTIFTNRRIPKNFALILLNFIFPIEDNIRYLGLIFNRKMNWQPHIKLIKDKVESKLNILSYLHGAGWGINQNVSRLLFMSMIRPIIDFGLPIYANNFVSIDKVNKIQNNCLRKVLSVLFSTPTNNLNAEAAIPPVQFRFNFLADKLILKALSIEHNPLINDIKNLDFSVVNSTWWSNKQHPLILDRWRSLKKFETEIQKTILAPSLCKNPKYQFFQPKIEFLNINNKHSVDPIVIQSEFRCTIWQNYPNFTLCYTDGAKTSTYTTAVFTSDNYFKLFKLSSFSSIFDAEALAIKEAILYFLNKSESNIVICSDSRSVLQTLLSQNNDLHPTINEIKHSLYENQSNNICLLWIPSHVGIPGNERADSLTKLLPLAHTTNESLYYKQLIPAIKKQTFSEWNTSWIDCTWKGQRLKSIMPSLKAKPWFHNLKWSRQDIKNISRLRIGHGLYPAHLFRCSLATSDLCECGEYGDLNHLIFQCVRLNGRDILIQNLSAFNLSQPFNITYILHNPNPKIYKLIANFLKINNINL